MTAPTKLRKPDHPIDPLFVERWSPRAFTGEALPADTLLTIVEAARWAPSAFNSQPWRFHYALRDGPLFPAFLDLLVPFNRAWAANAGVLMFAVASPRFERPGKGIVETSRSAAFDTGAAWANLALQATKLGWHAHAMGGFDTEKAPSILNLAPDQTVEAAIAIGRRGDPSVLPEYMRAGETPSARRPLAEILIEGALP